MDKFEVGEIVIFTPSSTCHSGLIKYTGEECTVDLPYGSHISGKYVYYGVIFSDGKEIWTAQHTLRKKKPPQELTTWESVQKITGWNPTKQKVIHGNYTYKLDE